MKSNEYGRDGGCGPANRTLRVLFVEDTPAGQLVGLRLFQAQGYRVFLAANGREAVEIFDREPVDLVVMDLHMPVMDGWQAVREIRRRESERPVPIVAVSAYSNPTDPEWFHAAGINAFVAKPIDKARLLQTIAQLCWKEESPRASE
ncbi:MAG TPA: response regulator [Pirellulales bacterium]|nr:response regulator [Pirellulales bacterium]